ncbi:MAG: sulfate adenylyltransferase [Candidatus Omnitrophota bacterium]|jgi:sulfate adenylyltransferase
MIKPHGGKLINRFLTKSESSAIIKLKVLPRITLDHDTLLDLENIAVGVYSPLEGFMTAEEFKSVTVRKRLPSGLPWTIPVLLPLPNQGSNEVSKDMEILLCNESNSPVGVIRVEDIYSPDKEKAAKHIFGTTSLKHPGVHKFYQAGRTFIGGKIWLIRKNKYPYHNFNLEPKLTRELINKRKWKTIAGFQTRNIPHRAHEFLQKIGLSLVDGILIHPIIGWKKKGDFNPEMIIKAYQILISHYYPQDRVIFSGLATSMRYAGPLEAVFHAIIRKNFGCTHFIVGRDHAGVGGFYDKYAAHRIFDRFPDLGIIPLLLNGPYYCKKCLSVVSDKICPHHDTHNIEISGTSIRMMITRGKRIGEEYLRPEIAGFIHKNKDKCFI